MILISRWSNKIAGSIFILLGIFCIFYLFYSQRLILDQHSFFIARYFKIILVIYGGFIFIVSGVLYFIGFLTPYYEANLYERAKSNIYSSIFGLPIFLLLLIVTSISFRGEEVRTYRILGVCFSSIMILFGFWLIISGLNTLKRIHKKK